MITSNIYLSIIHTEETAKFKNQVKYDTLTHLNTYMNDNGDGFEFDDPNNNQTIKYHLNYALPDPNFFLTLQNENTKPITTSTTIQSVSSNEITISSIIVLVSMIIIFMLSIFGFVKGVRFYDNKKKGRN